MDDKIKNPLGGILSGNFACDWSVDLSDSPGRLMEKAAERVLLPRQVKALKKENARLRQELVRLRRSVRPGKSAAPLKQIISGIKTAHPKFSQIEIARRVDYILSGKNRSLRDMCPKSWGDVPATMKEIFVDDAYKPLRKLVRAYISKS
jgi:hypothetical protein